MRVMETSIRALVKKYAPADLHDLAYDPLAASLFMPFNPRDPFSPAWDDGCRHSDPLVFVTKFLSQLSSVNDLVIEGFHCHLIWTLYVKAKTLMKVSIQNCHRVLLACLVLAMKWVEDDFQDEIKDFLMYLPFEMFSRITRPSMLAAMESYLFLDVFHGQLPFFYLQF